MRVRRPLGTLRAADRATRSRGLGVVVLEESAKPHSAEDASATTTNFGTTLGIDAPVAEPLVNAFLVVVDDVLGDRALKMPLAEGNDPVETLAADRAHPALAVGVQVRASARRRITRIP